MRGIIIDFQKRVELKGVGTLMVPLTVKDMQAGLADLDTKARILDRSRDLSDLLIRIWEWSSVMQTKQRITIIAWQSPVFTRGIHDATSRIGLCDRTSGMWTDGCRQDRVEAEFSDYSEQYGIDPGRIGIRQFGQIAYAHHDLYVGITPT